MNKYFYYKEQSRQEAIFWQIDFSNHNYSYLELYNYGEYFYKKAKRYGLIREFKENGVI